MKKQFLLLPVAVLALAACSDTPTGAGLIGAAGPLFHHMPPPTGVSASVSGTTVDVNWSSGGDVTTWVVEFQSCSSAGDATTCTGSEFKSEALAKTTFAYSRTSTPAGNFRVRVSSHDGGTNEGSWSAYTSIFTVAAPAPADATPPVIDYTLDPASPDGSNGWYRSNVTLTWTVTENESAASLVKTGCVDQNVVADQHSTTYSCSAASDGGSAAQVEVSIKRDATAPSVGLVGGPADGGSYYFGSVPGAPTCAASDATSGLAGPCSVSGYGTAVGAQTVTASATDNAGNVNTASVSYTVLAWTISGFYSPVNMAALNTVKGGSTVPLKFEIFAGVELTSTSAIKSFTTQQISCADAAVAVGAEDPVDYTSTGGTSLRYDATAGQFVQNWQTPKTLNACYRVTLTTQDDTRIQALFKTK